MATDSAAKNAGCANRSLLVTIDGPAGAGKTTVSQMLATQLGYRYLDTGALYRAVAFAAKRDGIAPDDAERLERLLARIHIDVSADRLLLDGLDISGTIRTPEITMLASTLSALPAVRRALFDIQRRIGEGGAVVAEGRDMGTVVFPDADVKFFLDATIRQRALRRFAQYGEDGGQTLAQIEAEIRQRDDNDSRRDLAPLKAAEDAIRIDSSSLSAELVVDAMLERIRPLMDRPPT